MVDMAMKARLTMAQLLQVALGTFGAPGLKGRAQRQHLLAGTFYLLTREGLPVAIRCQVHNAQVYAQRTLRLIWCWLWHVQGYGQIEAAISIEQISLPSDGFQSGLLIGSKAEGDQDATLQGQERDVFPALETHDTGVVDDGSLWPEMGLNAFIALVGFDGLANRSYRHLGRQMILNAQRRVHQLLQFKLVAGARGIGDFCGIVARLIKGVQRFKQRRVLFWRRSQFQDHRLLHVLSIAYIGKRCQ